MHLKGYVVVERRPDLIWLNHPISRGKNTAYMGFDGFRTYPNVDEWIEFSNSSIDRYNEDSWHCIELEEVLSYFNWFVRTYPDQTVNLLYLCEESDTTLPDPRFTFIGYDYGVVYEDYTYPFFSSLINEVRIGGNPLLTQFINIVNSFYLLPTLEDCVAYASARQLALKIDTSCMESAYDGSSFAPFKVFLFHYQQS
ncbi:hypothetical protein [Xanthocytophaga agilis]|uniref:Uncharacterized protein n=1 Tax=Xanthocytophaga agilis TaxID=3048010 RepID=A0AAE3R027_9BACT|nr:hypothetical protein [Xanthocytophaga agilis]MDJ1501239.1 hypothetical protein [Xanthocytophaga agilis]